MTDLENIYDEILEESAIDQFSSRVKKIINNAKLKFDSYTPLKQKTIIVGIGALLIFLITKIIKGIKNNQRSNGNRQLDIRQIERCHQLRMRVLDLVKISTHKNMTSNTEKRKNYNKVLDELTNIYSKILNYQDYLTPDELDAYSKKIDSLEKKI